MAEQPSTMSHRILHSPLLRGSSSIAVAMAVMNVATYLYTMLAARILGPGAYGAFAALMNLLLVVSVVSLGLQATAARRISAHPDNVAAIEREMMQLTRRAAYVLGAALLLLSPLINSLLRLDSLPAAALVGVAAVPVTIMGGQAGVLQGERRWWPLSLLYVAAGVPRLLVGTGMILAAPGELTAMIGVTVGCFAPVVVGTIALRNQRVVAQHLPGSWTRSALRETVHNSQALFAFFALSNADVIVARNVLDGHQSGLYAGGLILTKAVLFLPQFVVVVAFPAMSTAHERRRALTRGLGLVALVGLVSTAGAWLLSGLALTFVGGADYSSIQGQLWLFAVLGTALSMLQLLVYSVLAREGTRSTIAVWAALVALVLLGTRVGTTRELLLVVASVDAALLLVLFAASLYLVRDNPKRS